MIATIALNVDTASFEAGLAALAELAERLPEVGHGLVDFLDRRAGVAFDVHDLPAPGAGQIRVGFQPSDALIECLAAAGASDGDLLVVKNSSGHDLPSVGGVATQTIGQGEGPRR